MVADKNNEHLTHSKCGGKLERIFECKANPTVEIYKCLKCDEEGWIED